MLGQPKQGLSLRLKRSGTEGFLAIALGCLLSQLSLGLKFDQLHQIFNDQIPLEFFALLFCKRAVTLSMDEFVCSLSHLTRKRCHAQRIESLVLYDGTPRAYHRSGCVAKTL